MIHLRFSRSPTFNVVRADKPREAQAHPEDHRDLIVRVASYGDYFCELARR